MNKLFFKRINIPQIATTWKNNLFNIDSVQHINILSLKINQVYKISNNVIYNLSQDLVESPHVLVVLSSAYAISSMQLMCT